MDESDQQAQQAEAELLAQIGRCLFEQDLKIRVRLPAALAAGALAAWERDDTGADPVTETDAERTIRHQAGACALIGLAVEERSAPTEGDQVDVELDAWQIGNALDAADQRGLLIGLPTPGQNA